MTALSSCPARSRRRRLGRRHVRGLYVPASGDRPARAAGAAEAVVGVLQKFLPWVWVAILLLLVSGYWMVFMTFGGFARLGLHIHLMQGLGWVMIALFLWLFHGPWLKLKRAVAASDWPTAGANLNRIRQIIAVNLPLGLLVVDHRRERALLGLTHFGFELDGGARPLEIAVGDVFRHVEFRAMPATARP